MAVYYEVKIPGIEYSESAKTVLQLEQDGVIQLEDDLTDLDDNDIGSLKSAKTTYGDECTYPGIHAAHFTDEYRDTEGLRFHYYEQTSAEDKREKNFESIGKTILALSNISDKLKDRYGDNVNQVMREGPA